MSEEKGSTDHRGRRKWPFLFFFFSSSSFSDLRLSLPSLFQKGPPEDCFPPFRIPPFLPSSLFSPFLPWSDYGTSPSRPLPLPCTFFPSCPSSPSTICEGRGRKERPPPLRTRASTFKQSLLPRGEKKRRGRRRGGKYTETRERRVVRRRPRRRRPTCMVLASVATERGGGRRCHSLSSSSS